MWAIFVMIAKTNYSLKKRTLWRNYLNVDFYETLPPEGLIKASQNVGLDTCCDLKLIEKYINNATSILDIGPGYGRVINYIIDSGHEGELYAIERSKIFYHYLQGKVPLQVKLIRGDILDYSFKRKFDLILWLWAGFIEFSNTEQKYLFVKLASLLNMGGTVVIDVIPMDFRPPNSTLIDEQNYIAHLPQTTAPCYCFVPTVDDFSNYANLSSLQFIQNRLYLTPKNRERILYIFTKN